MKTANEISPLYRTTIKRNNVTIWTIASESGHTYSTTVFAGKVTSCKREDGTKCPGYSHYGKCHHAALVLNRERQREQPVAERAFETAPSGVLVPMR